MKYLVAVFLALSVI